MPERYATVQGVKLEWPKYELTTQRLEYLLPHGTPKAAIELPFYTIWKSTRKPAAQVSCTIEGSTARRRWKPKPPCRRFPRRSTKKPKKWRRKNAPKPKNLRAKPKNLEGE